MKLITMKFFVLVCDQTQLFVKDQYDYKCKSFLKTLQICANLLYSLWRGQRVKKIY